VWRGLGLMLVELSVVEQRYHAVMEVISGGIRVVEVAEHYGISAGVVFVGERETVTGMQFCR
jgi:hypothetical protein